MKTSLHTVFGGAVVVAALTVGAFDIADALGRWDSLAPAAPGTKLDSFAVHWPDGGTFRHDDLLGKISVVTFWASWCGPCQRELADLDELDDDYVGNERVQFVAVNWEGSGYSSAQRRAVTLGHARKIGLGVPVAYDDGSMVRDLRVRGVPHTLIVDTDGMVRHVYPGRVRASTIAEDIEDLLEDSAD